jgi:alpha,alpha-trehalose phosphorylase
VRVTVRQAEMEFAVENSADAGEKVDLEVRGVPVQVTAGAPITVPLADQGPRLPGEPLPVAGRRRADGSVIGAIVPGT